jgi:hypothetical protein
LSASAASVDGEKRWSPGHFRRPTTTVTRLLPTAAMVPCPGDDGARRP